MDKHAILFQSYIYQCETKIRVVEDKRTEFEKGAQV